MRYIGLAFVICFLASGCGSSSSIAPSSTGATGTIAFGMAQTNHRLQHPKTNFGPTDTFAYVAHLTTRRTISPNTRIREFFVRVKADGTEEPVFNDTFTLKVPVHRFITLNSNPIRAFYMLGFTRHNTYRVQLVQGGERLAEGTFSLD
jgi:hypothetical protein